MDLNLTFNETRVLGSLMEKEITTPDQYPLSLNALLNACNQKSNRDPVTELDEETVQEVVDGLIEKRLVIGKSGFGSRVVRYRHRFANTEFSDLQLSEQQLALICVLFLRGPQTPGELRSRTARLCRFADVREVEAVLQDLAGREEGALVRKLPREPGRRESRYVHLFCGEVDMPQVRHGEEEALVSDEDRVTALEQRVEEMSLQLERLMVRLERFDSER